MKGWLPLAVGGIAVAACTDTTMPRRPPNAQAPQLLEQQGPSPAPRAPGRPSRARARQVRRKPLA